MSSHTSKSQFEDSIKCFNVPHKTNKPQINKQIKPHSLT